MPGAERHRLGARDELRPRTGRRPGRRRTSAPSRRRAGRRWRSRADGALGGAVEVGVAQDQHRVLAAELERAADQPVGALLRDQLAGGGRAGEADVVGALDHRRAELAARARRRRSTGPGGKPASSSSCGAEQRREHRLGVGLGDHRVAGEQGREAVAQRHRERVVPRRDDPDDALGHVVDLDPGQPRDDAELALGVEVLVRRAGVVARGQRDVQRLVEGVLAGLAGLPADQVDDLVLAVEHQVVQPQQQLRRAARSVVRAQACCAVRARANASLDVGLARLRDHRRAAAR